MTTIRLREQDLDWRDIQDEIVALDTLGAMYYVLRGTGAVVWRLLAYSTTPDEIVERLVETYGIDQTRAADDVDHFLATLKGRGLLAS